MCIRDSANVASITIKTNANNVGAFVNGCFILADGTANSSGGDGAQSARFTGTGSTSSNTFVTVGVVTGKVSNVEPWPTSASAGAPAGSGYLTTPTITISAGTPEAITTAVATVRGEDTSSGGNINTKYISRRVTLEDGFDARDLKVIVNAYKPLGTGLHVYYKVKADEDPEDFDTKNYVLTVSYTHLTLPTTPYV